MGGLGVTIRVPSLCVRGQCGLAQGVQLVVRMGGSCGVWLWGQHVSVG